MRQKENPIDWDTYRFARKPRKPQPSKKRLEIKLTVDVPTFERLRNLAKREEISMSDAMARLINTPDAEKIEPTPEINWRTYWRKKESHGFYMLTNLLELGKNKTRR